MRKQTGERSAENPHTARGLSRLREISALAGLVCADTGDSEDHPVYGLFRQVLETATSGILVVNRDFQPVLVNAAFCKSLGLSEKDALSKKCYDFFPSSECHTSQCPLQRVLHGENHFQCEILKTGCKGETIPFRLTVGALSDSDGNAVGMVGDFVDISEIKLSELNLDLQMRKLEAQKQLLADQEAAVRQLARQIDGEKKQLEHQILANVNKIVVPMLRNITARVEGSLRDHVRLAETSLKEIVSPLVDERNELFAALTPREIEICNMIRHGHPTKEIAQFLNIAEGTVEQQRKQIRRKLGLKGSQTNLTSFLKFGK